MSVAVIVSSVCCGVVGLSLFAHYSDRAKQKSEAELAVRSAEKQRRQEDVVRFYAEHQAKASRFSRCMVGGQSALLILSADRRRLEILAYRIGDFPEVLKTTSFDATEIMEVAVEGRTETIQFTRREQVPVAHTGKTGSPVGRGLVGLALLGPVGAVMGAASGLAPKSTTKMEMRTVADHRTIDGAPDLTIGTRNPDLPFLRLRFAGHDEAIEWMYALRQVVEEADAL